MNSNSTCNTNAPGAFRPRAPVPRPHPPRATCATASASAIAHPTRPLEFADAALTSSLARAIDRARAQTSDATFSTRPRDRATFRARPSAARRAAIEMDKKRAAHAAARASLDDANAIDRVDRADGTSRSTSEDVGRRRGARAGRERGEARDAMSDRRAAAGVWVGAPAEAASLMERAYAVVDGSRSIAAGGGAGIIARTASAPLDRIKLLFQVQAVASSGTSATAYTGVGQAFYKIYTEEGILSFWKGNGVNVVRVAPYAAAQLASNDYYKTLLADENGKLGVSQRLVAGALAGMTGTALTHPLDTVRLRLALPNHEYKGAMHCFSTVYRTEGVRALYKGLGPTLAGIAPYAATNFASYDIAKKMYYGENGKEDRVSNLFVGGASGTFAATVCYPLDTIRRRMQMKGKTYNGMLDAITTIARTEGMRGFFRGWVANSLKVVPQNSIRFVSYEILKDLLNVPEKKAK